MKNKPKFNLKNTSIILTVVAIIWFVIDRLTKLYFDSGEFSLGQNITDSVFGIFHLTLVHNTGAAFGMFSNATLILGWISIVVSIFIFCFILFIAKKSEDKDFPTKLNILTIISAAIVIAGGLGNAVDRLVNGYVLDFICFDFIDFPVFNIADIGVTCGVFVLVFSLLFGKSSRLDSKKKS